MRYFRFGYTIGGSHRGSLYCQHESFPDKSWVYEQISEDLHESLKPVVMEITSIYEFKSEEEYKIWKDN